MDELLKNIDWMQVLSVLWTVVLLPVLGYIKVKFEEWMKVRNLEKYSDRLINAVDNVVKDMYETVVKEIKGTENWNEETQKEILETAKTKIKVSLTIEGCNFLEEVYEDLEAWIATLIEAKLYDLKNQ